MGKYFKRFENHSQYEQYIQSENYITPNISVCDDENKVHYNPIVITHEYVDLGLPSGTLWAAESIKDSNGNDLYFAWGETQGYTEEQVVTDKNFTWEDYEFGTMDNLSKYNESDEKTELDATDDAAIQLWGSDWRMPTKEQFDELTANTEYEWTEIDGVHGAKFTSKVEGYTDKFLFFPAVGSAGVGEVVDIGHYGYYWSVSLNGGYVGNAWYFYLDGSSRGLYNDGRCYGYSVRPVKNLTNQ